MKWKNLLAFPLTLGLVSILSVSVLALDTSISDVALESNSDTQPVAVIDISESQSNSLTEGTVEQNAPSETLGGEADQEKPEGNVPPEAPDGEVEQEKPEENVPSETPDGEIDQEKSEENVPSETPDGEIDQEKPEENVLPETSDEEIEQEKPEENVLPETSDEEIEQEKPEENVPSETPNGESGVDVIPEENPSQMLPDANAPQENAIVPDGWQQVNGNWYYYRNGEALKGSQTVPIDKTNTDLGATDWYFFDETGAMKTGPVPMFGGYQAYQDDGRLLHNGWAQIGGKYYYAQPNQQLSLGSVSVPVREDASIKDWYYITLDGGMQTGPVSLYGGYQCYYESGRLVYGGWVTVGGKTYYVDSINQQLSLGSVSVPVREDTSINDWYYITLDGGMQTGPIPMFGGYQAYKDDGRLLYGGWAQIGGKYYYAQPNQQLSLGSVYIPVREDTSISDWYYITVENGMRVGSVPIYGGYQCYYESGRLVYGGWATVNGKTYYADPSNQQLKTGTAVIDNVTYIFDSTGMLISEVHKGIDVSSHQGIIDWNQVRTSGVQFAVIRIMSWQGDAATGGYAIDPDFERNIREARAAGIYVGAYWYSVAFNGSEALQEVNIIKNSVAWNNVLNDGIILDLPMFIDYENNTAWFNSQTTYASRTEAVRMGMIYTENILGCRPGFYSSESYIENWFDGKQLIAEGYDCWVANWSGSHGLGDDAAMWQYTSKGSVSGINGNVDLNYCYNSDYFDSLKVYDQGIGKNVQGNAQTILTRVVQNEVGGMNNTEVYKAQAVAANTYMRYLIGQGKIPSVKLSLMVPSSAVRNAVAQVKGETVKYNGNLALTVYGSSSAGTTNKAYTYGWVELPYLTNVDNKYDTQYKNMTCYVKNSDLEKGIKALGGSTEGYDPSNWIQGCVFDQYGWLKSITLCGKTYTAEQFYENSWGLYSTNFKSFTYDSANSRWVFTGVNGNGHGIGMSQYGAKGMADAGYNYKQILNHYYPGTVII